MQFTIVDKIRFRRGDTYKLRFQRKNINKEVIMTRAEKLWFTVKKNYKTENKLIQKTLQDNTITFDDKGYYHIVLEPKDTRNMKYRKYVCDIQVENSGEVTTIYEGTFELLNEVTFEGGRD